MTAIAAARHGTAARNAAAIGHHLAHVLAWLWHSYAIVIHAVTHHQHPPSAQTAAFAATLAVVLLLTLGRRRRSAA